MQKPAAAAFQNKNNGFRRAIFNLRILPGLLSIFACIAVFAIPAERAVAADLQTSHEFNIPAQPLDAALMAFSYQAGVQVLMWANGTQPNPQSPGVTGALSARSALQSILSNTGLTFKEIDKETIAIVSIGKPAASAAVGSGNIRLAQGNTGAAQEAARAPASASEASSAASQEQELEEVVVTATKREEKVQKLPQAITAITSERLDELNAQTFEDYFRDVPGLMLVDKGDGKRDFSLRGMSNGIVSPNPTVISPATVSQYYDEIPITANDFQMNPRLVDMERIEVLRGPQGTLYGDGALAGTIRFITKKPALNNFSGSFEGRATATDGGKGSNNESLTLNVPLVAGRAALRLNAFYANDGGYVDFVAADALGNSTGVILDKNVDSSRSNGYRGQLLVQASDSLSILGQITHQESHSMSVSGYQPQLGDLLTSVCPPGLTRTPTSCRDNQLTPTDQNGNLYNLSVNADFGWAALVSSSSYAKTESVIDGIIFYTDGTRKTNTLLDQHLAGFSQELRLVSSKSWSTRWDYVLGAYYQDKTTNYYSPPTPILNGSTSSSNRDLQIKQKALFAEAGYMLTEHLQGRLGARVSDLSTDALSLYSPPLFTGVSRIPISSSFHPATGRAVLDYFINQDTMGYLSVGRGFRNGTINNTSGNYSSSANLPGFTPIPETSQPDTATTYELGWKQSFPSHKATINAAIYHTDWKDMQVLSYASTDAPSTSGPQGPGSGSIPPGIYPAFVNASKAVVDGVELETTIELVRGLQARASWTVLDPRLAQDFTNALPGGLTDLHGKKGDKVPFVARSSGSLSLNYRRPVFRDFNGFVGVNGQYQGPRATDFDKLLNTSIRDGGAAPVGYSTTYFEMKSYWTTSLQLGVQNASWRAALTLDNVLNQRAQLFNLGNIRTITNRPRTYGVWLRHNFE